LRTSADIEGFGTQIHMHESDNVDIYKSNIKLKRYREISSMPDMFPIKDEQDGFNISNDYKYFEFERIVRPVIMEGGKIIC
jgi:hypothetical protein